MRESVMYNRNGLSTTPESYGLGHGTTHSNADNKQMFYDEINRKIELKCAAFADLLEEQCVSETDRIGAVPPKEKNERFQEAFNIPECCSRINEHRSRKDSAVQSDALTVRELQEVFERHKRGDGGYECGSPRTPSLEGSDSHKDKISKKKKKKFKHKRSKSKGKKKKKKYRSDSFDESDDASLQSESKKRKRNRKKARKKASKRDRSSSESLNESLSQRKKAKRMKKYGEDTPRNLTKSRKKSSEERKSSRKSKNDRRNKSKSRENKHSRKSLSRTSESSRSTSSSPLQSKHKSRKSRRSASPKNHTKTDDSARKSNKKSHRSRSKSEDEKAKPSRIRSQNSSRSRSVSRSRSKCKSRSNSRSRTRSRSPSCSRERCRNKSIVKSRSRSGSTPRFRNLKSSSRNESKVSDRSEKRSGASDNSRSRSQSRLRSKSRLTRSRSRSRCRSKSRSRSKNKEKIKFFFRCNEVKSKEKQQKMKNGSESPDKFYAAIKDKEKIISPNHLHSKVSLEIQASPRQLKEDCTDTNLSPKTLKPRYSRKQEEDKHNSTPKRKLSRSRSPISKNIRKDKRERESSCKVRKPIPVVKLRASSSEGEQSGYLSKDEQTEDKDIKMLHMLKSGLAAKAKITLEKKKSNPTSPVKQMHPDLLDIKVMPLVRDVVLPKVDKAEEDFMKDIFRARSRSLSRDSKISYSSSHRSSSGSRASPIRKSKSRSHSRSSRSVSRDRSSSASSRSSYVSSVSTSTRRSRSISIPRRRGSPSFLSRRRITSARKRPIPYTRASSYSSVSTCSCDTSYSPRRSSSRSPSQRRSLSSHGSDISVASP